MEYINNKFEIKDLEIDLMALLLQDRKAWVDFKDHIDPNYFNNQSVSQVFELTRLFFNKYKDYPSQKQLNTLAERKKYSKETFKTINEIFTKNVGIISPKDRQFLIDETSTFIKNSKIERAILKSADLLDEKKYDNIRDVVMDAVNWQHEVNLGTEYSDVVTRYAKLYDLIHGVIESPWPSLNFAMGGGFFKKELSLIAAGSSVGKSIALDQIALYAWDVLGLNVCLITLEMSEERKGQRMDACKFSIPVTNVYNEKDTIINHFEKEGKRKNKLYIKEMPQRSTTADIENFFYQVQLYDNVIFDILIVDYLDLMGPRHDVRGNEYLDQGTVGEDLRDLAKAYYMPVISASQFSRGAIDVPVEELTENKIADSWKKMMIADTIIGLVSRPEERRQGIMYFKMLKNRNGPKDLIMNMRIQYEILKITDNKKIKAEEAKEIMNERKKNKKSKEE